MKLVSSAKRRFRRELNRGREGSWLKQCPAMTERMSDDADVAVEIDGGGS